MTACGGYYDEGDDIFFIMRLNTTIAYRGKGLLIQRRSYKRDGRKGDIFYY